MSPMVAVMQKPQPIAQPTWGETQSCRLVVQPAQELPGAEWFFAEPLDQRGQLVQRHRPQVGSIVSHHRQHQCTFSPGGGAAGAGGCETAGGGCEAAPAAGLRAIST